MHFWLNNCMSVEKNKHFYFKTKVLIENKYVVMGMMILKSPYKVANNMLKQVLK